MKAICPFCKKEFEYDYDSTIIQAAAERNENKGAWMKLPAYVREVFMTGMCYGCQSMTFHVSTPGFDLGEPLGNCPCCDTPFYKGETVCSCCHEDLPEV